MRIPPSWRNQIPLCSGAIQAVTVWLAGRIDFAGGWSDTPPQTLERFAAVLNSTVLLREPGGRIPTWMLEIKVRPTPKSPFSVWVNGQVDKNWRANRVLSSTLKQLNLLDTLPKASLSINNRIPPGSGLGGSSLLATGILAALVACYNDPTNTLDQPGLIVNAVLNIEQEMGSGGGWQDQIGGMLPGIKLTTTSPTETGLAYNVRYCCNQARLLNQHCLVLDLKSLRISRMVLGLIVARYQQGDPTVLRMLDKLPGYAVSCFHALDSGNIACFAAQMLESWRMVIATEAKTSLPIVEQIQKICGDDLIGYKIAGAGGGGYMLLVFKEPDLQPHFIRKLACELPSISCYYPHFGVGGMRIMRPHQLPVRMQAWKRF